MNTSLSVTFFRVREAQTKISLISKQIEEAYKQEKRVLIAAPNEEAAKYIDALLWRLPEDSFIPHTIVKGPSQDWIAITTIHTKNWNKASLLLNLCPEISPIYDQFEEVYELFDETHPGKSLQSQKKKDLYASKGISIKER